MTNMLKVEGMLVNHDGQKYGQVEINRSNGLIEKVGSPSGDADLKAGGVFYIPRIY